MRPVLERAAVVVAGTIWRWKPRNGTGVIMTDDETLVWFHLSAVHGESISTITQGMPVDVDIDDIPQEGYEYRAKSVRRRFRTARKFVPVVELARTSALVPRVDYAEWRADMDAMVDQEFPDRE
ncbi:hypothetical protein GV792_21655 [Nocardia cyriacigeorgica]|uniref:Cold shock domain-containing protein n=1 Tax=Nocardia cyriacigeorgica TaxID=135487 RepID=A0A6P1D8L8_9NOCA|nr:hypothetical protein [Nocardia cyriacigeorgica]NEW38197.1 hypothetical protein [Nocardia cyriacigeorgica]NEW47036.1 hypothetical protein [Nocardia cyriacigeorgica]NEW52642.1 hypothetical protein [Nocardia cyriacigeorgica]